MSDAGVLALITAFVLGGVSFGLLAIYVINRVAKNIAKGIW